MALQIGDAGAAGGMTKEIYDKLNELLMPSVPQENLTDAQNGWKKLAFAIATGVVTHVLSNMEVAGVSVSGQVSLPLANNAAAGAVTLAQSGPTTGHIR